MGKVEDMANLAVYCVSKGNYDKANFILDKMANDGLKKDKSPSLFYDLLQEFITQLGNKILLDEGCDLSLAPQSISRIETFVLQMTGTEECQFDTAGVELLLKDVCIIITDTVGFSKLRKIRQAEEYEFRDTMIA